MIATVTPPRAAARKSGVDWSPYLVGVGIGLLSWIAFAVAKHPLGVTHDLSRLAAPVAEKILGSDAVAHNSYWKPAPFSWDYGVIFLVGLMLGAFVAALTTRSLRFELVPQFWRERFGGSVVKRLFWAFVGGALLMFGARMAGGCTSGHAISGGLQLALSSWVFVLVTFASALTASALIFGRKPGDAKP